MLRRPKRNVNRLLVLCTSINDVTVWPFWKFLQMKKLKGITDMAFLAFNSHGGSFEAAITGTTYKLKNYARVTGYRQDMLEDFLHRWHDPGRSYFVYGGHGMGDYLEFETDKVALQAHELANIMGKRRFEAMVFDACFMANLDCVYHLRHNTRYIGACEGYMWEPDTELDLHVLNTHNASVMTRYKNPLHILRTIQADYCARCPRGDFAILDTTHAAELRRFVATRVVQRVYDRATLYTPAQQNVLAQHAARTLQMVHTRYHLAGGEHAAITLPARTPGSAPESPVEPDAVAVLPTRRTRRQRLDRAVQLEHALYPSEPRDKHLVDLKSYLVDLAVEEEDTNEKRNCDVAPFAESSAHHGLDLFHKVVLHHTPPRAWQLYGTHLGGLSLTVHEFSALSRPVEPLRGDRRLLNRRCREFEQYGALREVRLRDRPASASQPQPLQSAARDGTASAALCSNALRGAVTRMSGSHGGECGMTGGVKGGDGVYAEVDHGAVAVRVEQRPCRDAPQHGTV